MPAINATSTTLVTPDSGAFEINKNAATVAGYAAVGSGTALALGVGAAVAPAPVMGLITLGAGCVVAGNYQDIKAHFAAKTAPAVEPAA